MPSQLLTADQTKLAAVLTPASTPALKESLGLDAAIPITIFADADGAATVSWPDAAAPAPAPESASTPETAP